MIHARRPPNALVYARPLTWSISSKQTPQWAQQLSPTEAKDRYEQSSFLSYIFRDPLFFFRSHTLRQERRLRVFENRVLWKIFGPKRDDVTREWRRVHNEELYDLYPSPVLFGLSNQELDGWACGCYGRDERCIQGFVGETWGKGDTSKA
jgi:hypothetical protein